MKVEINATKQTNESGAYVHFYKSDDYKNFLKGLADGSNVIITLSNQRSLNKNSCLHGWVRILADEWGEDFEFVKSYLVIKHFGYLEKEMDGELYKVPISTSKLDDVEFAKGLNKLYIWALSQNITLPNKEFIQTLMK